MILLQMFCEFFKTGLFSIGGGLATLPFLYDISDRLGWFSQQQIADMIAISESTPGPIGINMATFAGYQTAGIAGSICATLGLVSPAIIIILAIASILERYRSNQYIKNVFYGIRPASVAMICSALFSLILVTFLVQDSEANILDSIQWEYLLLAVGCYGLMRVKKSWHPAVFLAIGAAGGILFGMIG